MDLVWIFRRIKEPKAAETQSVLRVLATQSRRKRQIKAVAHYSSRYPLGQAHIVSTTLGWQSRRPYSLPPVDA